MQYAVVAALAAVAVALPAEEWAPYTTTTTSAWEEVPKTTTSAEWNTWSNVPEKKTCTTTYTTKDCGDGKDWNACKDVTKTETLYDDKCTWAGWDKPAPTTWEEVKPKETWAPAPVKETWAPAPVKVCTYVTTYTTTYVTKEAATKSGWDTWAEYKDVTKTETKTETKTDEKCTGTWGDWNTWKPAPAPATTWAEAPKASSWSEAPAPKAAETWAPAPAPASKPAASSTVWSPVAKFTGAADKQTVGFGAAAIAAIAMML